MVSILSIEGKPVYGIYELVIDEASELQDLTMNNVKPGSKVLCIENSKTYMMDSSGTWNEVNFKSGGGSGESESELPTVDGEDNGKVLTVVEGAWDKVTPTAESDVMAVQLYYSNGNLSWKNGYTKRFADIRTALAAGKFVFVVVTIDDYVTYWPITRTYNDGTYSFTCTAYPNDYIAIYVDDDLEYVAGNSVPASA